MSRGGRPARADECSGGVTDGRDQQTGGGCQCPGDRCGCYEYGRPQEIIRRLDEAFWRRDRFHPAFDRNEPERKEGEELYGDRLRVEQEDVGYLGDVTA